MFNKSTCAECKWGRSLFTWFQLNLNSQYRFSHFPQKPISTWTEHCDINFQTLLVVVKALNTLKLSFTEKENNQVLVGTSSLDFYRSCTLTLREHCVVQWIIFTAPTGRRSEHGDWHLIIWSAVSRGVDPAISVRQVQMITVPSDSWHWQMSG